MRLLALGPEHVMIIPFVSWMSLLALEYLDRAPAKKTQDALNAVLQQKGCAHEDALEAQLVAEGKPSQDWGR